MKHTRKNHTGPDNSKKLAGSDTKIYISRVNNTPLNRSTELTTKSPLDRGEIITNTTGTLSNGQRAGACLPAGRIEIVEGKG